MKEIKKSKSHKTSSFSLEKEKEELFFLDQAMDAARRAAALAREVLLKNFGNLSQVREKDKAGLVTEVDKESERQIRKVLRMEFPHFSILGEEEGLEEPSVDLKPGVWIIDPLDGTTNYVHQFPIFCISIGLEWKGDVVLGLVDVPLLNKVYSAKKNQGAFVNSRPLHVSQKKDLSQALVATGLYPYCDQKEIEWQLKLFGQMVQGTRGVRRAGAAAYDLCLVAEGVFDAFWEKHLKAWDTAAGLLLIREAGGVVKDYEGKDFHTKCRSIVASNSHLLQKMLKLIQS